MGGDASDGWAKGLTGFGNRHRARKLLGGGGGLPEIITNFSHNLLFFCHFSLTILKNVPKVVVVVFFGRQRR